MKKSIALVFALAVLGFAFACSQGCHTTPPTTGQPSTVYTDTNGIVHIGSVTVNPDAVANVIRIAAQAGAAEAINADPNAAAYLRAASVAITASLDAGNYDPAALQKTLDTISVKELRNAEVQRYVSLAVSTYAAFYSQMLSAKANEASPYLRPALLALRDGIDSALPLEPTPAQSPDKPAMGPSAQ